MKILILHSYYQQRGGEDAVFQAERDALIDAGNEKALATFVAAMLENPDQRRRLGEHAVAATRPLADLPGLTAEALLSLLPRS